MLSPRAIAAGIRVRQPSLALPRLSEGAAIASATFVIYLIAGAVLAIGLNFVVGDAWSRVTNAYYVLFSRDPHLAAIGFVWNPLPSLMAIPLLPLKAILPPLATVGFVANVYSAIFMAGSVYFVWRILADLGVIRWMRLLVVVAFAMHPMILQYGANGMTEALFIFLILGEAMYLMRWLRDGDIVALVFAGCLLGIAYMVRYEAVAIGMATGMLVFGVGFLQADGGWRFRAKTAVADAIVFGMPLALAFVLWAGVSWLIVGSPFEQFGSVYGTTSQLSADYENIIYRTSQGEVSITYILGHLLILEPAFMLLGGAALVLALWRRDVRVLPIVGILGAVLAFALAAFLTGKTGGWVRYYITIIPLTVLLAGTLLGRPEPPPEWLSRPLAYLPRLRRGPEPARLALDTSVPSPGAHGRRRAALAMAIGILLLLPMVTMPLAMASPRFGMDQEFANDRGRVLAAAAIGKTLDAMDLPDGSVLMDVFLGFGIVVNSDHPRQFVITPDRDFKAILADPAAFNVRYLLVPAPDRELGELDALNRQYPTLYADGAGIATLVREFDEFSPYFAWRLYEVDR